MIVTRKIVISDRVFKVADLKRIAGILDRQVSDGPLIGIWTKYEVAFEEDRTIEGTAAELFTEEELDRPSRPYRIEMRLTAYGAERYIRINLRSGDSTISSENAITISGDDADWLNANFAALTDALAKVTPQSLWWKKHRILLLNFIAIGLGTLLQLIGMIGAILLNYFFPGPAARLASAKGPDWSEAILSIYSIFGISAWFWRWLLGFTFAFQIRRWLLSMWPDIEFDFGSPRLRPDQRRRRLNWVLTALIVPLLLAALYDIIKSGIH